MTTPQNQYPHPTNQPQGPWRITFDTNPDDCNLACIMCEEHSLYQRQQKKQKLLSGEPAKPRRMNPELIHKIVREASAAGLREIIPSTMGEPLLYPYFDAIITCCRQYGVFLNLTTNGTFPGRPVDQWGKLILPIASDVKISWNGSTSELSDVIMVGSHFNDRLAKLKTFIDVRDGVYKQTGHRARLTFQMTFMEVNFQDIPAFLKFAANLGIDRIKGHHLWVHYPGMERQSMRRSVESIKRWNSLVTQLPAYVDQYRRPDGTPLLLENFFPIDPSSPQVGPEFHCPFLDQEAWVAHDGRFNPCCAPDQQRQELGNFGNFYDRNLLELWQSAGYRQLCSSYTTHRVCQTCTMRRPVCDGGRKA